MRFKYFILIVFFLFSSIDSTVLFAYNKADLMKLLQGERNLRGSDLRGAELVLINLRGADLSEANLSMADLRSAEMNGADLRNSFLNGTNLSYAILDNVNLTGANLQNAILTNVSVKLAKIPVRFKILLKKYNVKNLSTVIWIN